MIGGSDELVITLTYKPRPKFLPFHNRTQKYAVMVAHRRAGKTVAAINDVLNRALHVDVNARPNPHYGYIAPELKQAKKLAWTYLKDAVRKIPNCKISETELSVLLPNTATIRLYGSDNEDSLRGGYFDGVIFDEFGDIKSTVWSSVVRPSLIDRDGWVVFMGTPKGKNAFYRTVITAQAKPAKWYFLCLKASESGHISPALLAEDKADMEPDEYEREYECSFEASTKGSYYGTQVVQLLERTKPLDIAYPIDYDPTEPVELAMDIGRRDATAIWFWQTIAGEVRFIDYFEETGWDADDLVEMLQLKPYNYQAWWVPHDALHKTFATKKSVIDTFRSYEAPARKVPDPDAGNRVFHGTDLVRKTLKKYPLRFDLARCARGLEALKSYSRKWNEDTGVFADAPNHDHWSHGADAFRYACAVINPTTIQKSVEVAAVKRSQQIANASKNISTTAVINTTTWTFNEAWERHDELVARTKSDWRHRI